ncbi:MAG: PEP/pyruvate-binding domain-containing protein [Nocardioides sp.]|uniref:PEP/pyruvate-binding domain-containing protein n=1 Tax=Nocardioides sp. TaxID=35761 RepID=UPI0039E422DA
MTSAPVLWLDTVEPEQAIALTGAKMGRLCELRAAGAAVPDGFSVSIDGYRQHTAAAGLDDFIETVLGELGSDPSPGDVETASATIRGEFEVRPVEPSLASAIIEAYDELSERCLEVNPPVAVRSSATGEDSADASFAGIFDTYLGISGADRVLGAVRRCWGSLFTGRALDYRHRRGISHLDMPIAVGVIELVHARCSGVAFSVHPVTGKTDRVVIEGNWGWGEAVVQGLVTPDHIEVGKSDRRVLRHEVAKKTVVSAFDYARGHVVETDMPARLAERPILDDEQIGAITEDVLAIEKHYGYPVDVEWVISRHRRSGDPVSIVQARPVSVASVAPTPGGWNPVAMAAKHAFHTP